MVSGLYFSAGKFGDRQEVPRNDPCVDLAVGIFRNGTPSPNKMGGYAGFSPTMIIYWAWFWLYGKKMHLKSDSLFLGKAF